VVLLEEGRGEEHLESKFCRVDQSQCSDILDHRPCEILQNLLIYLPQKMVVIQSLWKLQQNIAIFLQ
jgi:hypothetical protein